MNLVPKNENATLLANTNLIKKTFDYKQASKRPNTKRTYASLWGKFDLWCLDHGLCSLPASAEAISLYLGSLGGSVSFSTIDGSIAAIEDKHKEKGRSISGNQDLYRSVRKGIRNTHKENQTVKQAKPLTTLDLKVACCRMGDSLQECRDRAVLTVIFFGAFRRSELSALDRDHVQFNEKGMIVSVMQSKTSQTREDVYLSYAKDKDICPVTSLKAWLERAQITSGPIFRSFVKGGKVAGRLSGHGVSEIIKRHFCAEYSGHSARRGLLTESAEKGTSIHVMQKHSRHKTANMLLHYIEKAKGFDDSSVSVLGV